MTAKEFDIWYDRQVAIITSRLPDPNTYPKPTIIFNVNFSELNFNAAYFEEPVVSEDKQFARGGIVNVDIGHGDSFSAWSSGEKIISRKNTSILSEKLEAMNNKFPKDKTNFYTIEFKKIYKDNVLVWARACVSLVSS